MRVSSTTLTSGDVKILGGVTTNLNGKMIFEADNVIISNIDIEKIGGSNITLSRKDAAQSLPVTPDNATLAAIKDIAGDAKVLEKFTGNAAITAVTGTITFAKKARIAGFQLHLSGNPTTPEDFLITKDDIDAATYDTAIFKQDLSIPAANPVTDIVKLYENMNVEAGEKWIVTWPNTEGLTYGFKIFGTEID